MHVTSHTTVAAPIETVWDALTNHMGISQWAPGLTVTMDKLGAPDPNGVGAIRRIASPGPAPDIVEEVETFEPPQLLRYKALSGTPFPGYAAEVRLTEVPLDRRPGVPGAAHRGGHVLAQLRRGHASPVGAFHEVESTVDPADFGRRSASAA